MRERAPCGQRKRTRKAFDPYGQTQGDHQSQRPAARLFCSPPPRGYLLLMVKREQPSRWLKKEAPSFSKVAGSSSACSCAWDDLIPPGAYEG